MTIAKKVDEGQYFHAKEEPGRCRSPVLHLGLPALAVSIKPFAHTVADYARSDRHKKVDEVFQYLHLLSVARLEKGSKKRIPQFDRIRKKFKSKTTVFFTVVFFYIQIKNEERKDT